MGLEIVTFQLGPMQNNTYLIADGESGQAVVIDPSFDSEIILTKAVELGWKLTAIWLTHAHFDHIAGVKTLADAFEPALPVGLHPLDLPMLKQNGGSRLFGMKIDPVPAPAIHFDHGQVLWLGQQQIEVRHTPGHTPGHVVFSAAQSGVVFCGDLIFYHGVGRTDLAGGDYPTLLQSIHTQIFTLPPETRLLSGHGPETTVSEEEN
jgi:glyoxylase-like metal-dependent hydrolase (beta-lactamase superfamily II)